jgi:hypothetical protein
MNFIPCFIGRHNCEKDCDCRVLSIKKINEVSIAKNHIIFVKVAECLRQVLFWIWIKTPTCQISHLSHLSRSSRYFDNKELL